MGMGPAMDQQTDMSMTENIQTPGGDMSMTENVDMTQYDGNKLACLHKQCHPMILLFY